MTTGIAIMYAVAAVAAVAGAILLLRLARPHSARTSYVNRIAGVMLVALGATLVLYASTMLSWGPPA